MTMVKYICFLLVLFLGLFACQSPASDFTMEAAKVYAETAWSTLPQLLDQIDPPQIKDQEFLITDYDAKDDSLYDSRPGIMAAMAACHAAGGGKVVFPPGTYFSKGPIHLQSGVELHLAEGAELKFSNTPADYLPLVKVRWEGTVCWNYSPLIYGFQVKDVALTGKGTIDGNGREWSMEWRKQQKPDKDRLRQMGNDTIPEDQRVFGHGFLDLDGDGRDDGYGDGQAHYLRPTLFECYACERLLLEDLEVRNSPFWTIHPVFSRDVIVRNLRIYGGYLNDDGIDPDSSEEVLIEGCYIETEDDAISIKAGRDQDAWNRPPSRKIVVRNCRLNSGVNAFCIGSEMSGGVEQVYVEDCKILNGKHGLNFKCNLDRGGQVQQIFMRNIEIDQVEEAMFIFRMDYHGYRGNHFPTEFNDFYASNIRCQKVVQLPFKIVGVADAPIQRIHLQDIEIGEAGAASLFEHTQDVLLDGVRVNGQPVKLE